MKHKNIVFIVIFLLAITVPVLAAPFFRDSVNTEKRDLAKFPALVTENGINNAFASELDDFLRDHIAFRNKLVYVRSLAMDKYFGESSVSSVIIGNDGWLYYADELDDFLNIPTISERSAKNIAKTYKLISDELAKSGRRVVFAVAPNKSTLYYENVPERFVPAIAKGNMELLFDAFDEAGVEYVNLVAGLGNASEPLYQKTDTHWTYEGALEAYRLIMKKSGLGFNAFGGMTFTERRDWDGDLAVMLYSSGAKQDIQKYCDYDFLFKYTSHEKNYDALTLETRNSEGNGNIVVYRDSFCNTMHVFFAENAETALFSRVVPYNISYTDNYDADLAVFEITERHISSLAEMAPVMAAPRVEIAETATSIDPALVKVERREKNGMVHYYGTVDKSLLKDDYDVYILFYNDNGNTAYTAFPIYEKELLGADSTGDNGFSAYFDETAVTGKKMAVAIRTGNELFFANVDAGDDAVVDPVFARGFVKKDGITYFLDLNDQPVGHLEYEGSEYYLNEDGSLYYGWIRENGMVYYYNRKTGEKTIGEIEGTGNKYRFNADGTPISGWYEDESGKHFYDEDGILQTGICAIDGELYHFDDDGNLAGGWIEENRNTMFFDGLGRAADGWETIDGNKYYFADHIMTKGWITLDGESYYLPGGIMATGRVSEGDITYYLADDGRLLYRSENRGGSEYFTRADDTVLTGWNTVEGVDLHFTDGIKTNGELEIDGIRFLIVDGRKAVGLITIGGTDYYFTTTGEMVKNSWQTIDGSKYYFGETGAKTTGFSDIGGSRYYFDESGKMLTGLQTVDGSKYYFYDNGKMAKNAVVGDYKFDANGVGSFTFAKITRENLDAYIEKLLNECGRSLEGIFKRCGRDYYTYFYRTPASTVEDLAINMFNTGKGSCYEFSAITYLMVKALGYNCQIVVGKGAYYECHRWVIIEVEPGVWRHMDTERKKIKVFLVTDAQLDAWNWCDPNIRYEWDKSQYPHAE